jgi:PPOX class probable F420-dependent enzyme
MSDAQNPTSVLDLAACEYVLLTTYTADGRAKPTPVWVARDDDALVAYSDVDAWKVRRVRRTPRVTMAACDSRGRPRGGPVDGVAVLVEGRLAERVDVALRAKYGWKKRTIDLVNRVRHRGDGATVGIVVRDAPRA